MRLYFQSYIRNQQQQHNASKSIPNILSTAATHASNETEFK